MSKDVSIEVNKPKERFVFIDGLRAVLAVDVMFHHLYFMHDTSQKALQSVLPAILRWPMEQDLQRVQCFFVISGFVIAWSLRKMTINWSNALNFILRRQIRLDPAYWVCLFVSVGFMIAQSVFVNSVHWADVARPGRLLINMMYLQYITKTQPILYVSWTLCLEIQLYLAYIIHLALIQYLIRTKGWAQKKPWIIYVGVMLPLWLVSLWTHWDSWAWPWVVQSWYLFGMGVLLCWLMEGRIPTAVLYAAFLGEIIYGIGVSHPGVTWGALLRGNNFHDPHVFWSVGITMLIYVAILRDALKRWLKNGVMQYLGRISYSLFLVHWDVGRMVLGWGMHFKHTRGAIVVWFFLACLVCIAAAHLLYILVERPSMNWAARLKPKPAKTIPPEVAVHPAGLSAGIENPAANPA